MIYFDILGQFVVEPAAIHNVTREVTMAKSNVRFLATKSQRVYERMMIDHFAEEFRKQRQVQFMKFFNMFLIVCGLAGLAVVLPLALSRILMIIFS